MLLSGPAFSFDQTSPLPPVVAVGKGSLTTVLPAGALGPSQWNAQTQAFDRPVLPNTSADFSGPITTNKWWSALAYPAYPPDPNRVITLQPHPLAMRPYADGLGISYPTNVQFISDSSGVQRQYEYPYAEDFKVGLDGLNSSLAVTNSYSDWAVTAAWQSGADALKATFGEGLPFVYFTRAGQKDAVLTFAGPVNVWYNQGGVVGVTIGGHNYGIFGPSTSTWTQSGNQLRSNLNQKDYFSIAVLPDNSLQTLQFYRSHAYAFVTDTKVSWAYSEASAQIATTYTVSTVLKESGNGNVNNPLLALFRHQWLHASNPLTNYTYVSPLGQMKVLDGSSFNTTMTNYGTLPFLPTVGVDQAQLYNYIDQIYKQPNLFPAVTQDTYDAGKTLQEIASLIPLAEQAGHTAARDRFLHEVEQQLQNWFTGTTGKGQFYYNQKWSTLIGYPDGFGSATELNDHHFHYGYFIMAAGIVAEYDPVWAQQSNWGGMVDGLVRDVANGDRTDKTFPFLRNFDVYQGHSWASGHANFFSGNDEESSSESLNFDSALIVWGSATHDTTIRDLGVYLYTTEVAAVEQYWFNVDKAAFPAGFQHDVVGMVWGDGATYGTWFSADPAAIHGINFLPFSGGSIYLGRHPDYVAENYAHMVAMNGGPEQTWQDRIWSYQAFSDPAAALAKFNANPNYVVSAGESRPHTYAWLHSLDALGHVDTSVTADVTTYAVFNKAGVRTYVA
jgi:endoglucanase Acf2